MKEWFGRKAVEGSVQALCHSANAGADASVSGSRFGRVWVQVRSRLGAGSVASGTMFADKYGICIVRLSNLFSALPILKVNSISIKHRRWGMTPSLLCSWDDRIKKDCLSTLDRQSFSVLYSHEA